MRAQLLPSGNYRICLSDGFDEDGKRVYKSFTVDSEWKVIKLAEDYKKLKKKSGEKNKRKRKVQEPDDHKDVKNFTLQRAFRNYIATRSNVIELTTVRNYDQIADHCFQCIMDIKLKNLTILDIQEAVKQESKRVGPKYVKNAYGLLKSVLKMHDVELKLDSIKLPKLRKKEKELPTFARVYSIVKGKDSELPVLLASWLSLRIGEVIGLQFRDVDMKKRRIYVQRTIVKTKEGYMVHDGCKTEKSERDIRIPDYILNMIQSIPHEADTDFIIPRTRKSVYSKYKRLMEKNGMNLTFHSLRHTNTPFSHHLRIAKTSHYPPATK